jgi:hypothetical protein
VVVSIEGQQAFRATEAYEAHAESVDGDDSHDDADADADDGGGGGSGGHGSGDDEWPPAAKRAKQGAG